MDIKQEFRTDLALEERERFNGQSTEVEGVSLEENWIGTIKISKVEIFTENGAKEMRKPEGTYVTIEADELKDANSKVNKDIPEVLSKEIEKLMPDKTRVLIVGLGNRFATPDALGPVVIEKVNIGERLYAMAPGVLAQTGMETVDMVKGVVNQIKPSMVVVIDALAARNTRRVNSTIQITDTGICPGSGVGNHRKEINEKILGVPVVAIGVPTVVDAATIVKDTMEALMDELAKHKAFSQLKNSMECLDERERVLLMKEVMKPEGNDM